MAYAHNSWHATMSCIKLGQMTIVIGYSLSFQVQIASSRKTSIFQCLFLKGFRLAFFGARNLIITAFKYINITFSSLNFLITSSSTFLVFRKLQISYNIQLVTQIQLIQFEAYQNKTILITICKQPFGANFFTRCFTL